MKQCIVFSRFSIGYVRLQNSRFRKAGSAVSVILECEARESHTPCGRVRRENLFFSVSYHSPSPFFHSLQPFVRIWSVARVRKKIRLFCSLRLCIQCIQVRFNKSKIHLILQSGWSSIIRKNRTNSGNKLHVLWVKRRIEALTEGDTYLKQQRWNTSIQTCH